MMLNPLLRLNRLNRLSIARGAIAGVGDGEAYGVRYRDTGSGYAYERTGVLADFSADTFVPDEVLPLQRQMRRCILNAEGEVEYYTDPLDTMYKEGGARSSVVEVLDVYSPHSQDIAWVRINGAPDPAHIGSMIRLEDLSGTRAHYALIIGVDADVYLLSNPLLIDWGLGADEKPCPTGIIGDAKLDGSDGQLMVEVPGYYHRYIEGIDKTGPFAQLDMSRKPFPGADYMPPFYQSAMEGVITDALGIPVDGWYGEWDEKNQVWENMSYTPLGLAMVSVVGFYPRTYVYRSDVRAKCAALGKVFHQQGFYNNLSLQYLMLVEAASFQTQAKFGDGIVD